MRQPHVIASLVSALLAVIAANVTAPDRSALSPPDAEAESGPTPDGRAEFFEMQRRRLDGRDVPPDHLLRVFEDIRTRERAPDQRTGEIVTGWTELGPGNVGGRTRTLVIDPISSFVMYAGGVSGGVWKTTNGGASWFSLDDMMLNMSVCTIAMDPTDHNTLYAGTGEGMWYGTGDAGRGNGIFKSTDAGATWTHLSSTANAHFNFVNKLVISPNDSARIYAGTRSGVFRSVDAGESWQLVLANWWQVDPGASQSSNGCQVGCLDLAIRNDTIPDTIFAAFGSFLDDGLFRSTDGGATWSLVLTDPEQGRMSLALAPSDNSTLYVSMANNADLGEPMGKLVQVYRSIDGGATFQPRADLANDPFAPWLLSNLNYSVGCYGSLNTGQGWYDNIIAVDPIDPNIVWIGGVDLLRSDDGGATWGVARDDSGGGSLAYPHVDQHGIVFHPGYDGITNQIMFVTNDGGIYRTVNARATPSYVTCPVNAPAAPPGIAWQALNLDYGVTQFYHGDTSPTIDRFIGGTQDNGTIGVSSATGLNNWLRLLGSDGGYCAIDPTNPSVMYMETQYFPNIYKTTSSGASVTRAVAGIMDSDGLFITPFAMDPSNPQILWTGGSRPWYTTDGAAYWLPARTTAFSSGGRISAIAIAPTDSNIVCMGLSNGRVFRSTNALAPLPIWTESNSAQGLIDGAYVSSIAIHPTDPAILYLTYSTYGVPHVYRTIDGGASWARIDGAAPNDIPDIPAHWIAPRPSNPNQLFLGTELGVFTSNDAGTTWIPVPGIPHTIVETLDFQRDDQLVAFTHGRGAWRATLVCAGDLTGDQLINLDDLQALLFVFGSVVPPGTGPDLDGSGTVDLGDLQLLLFNFGQSCA
ncbi:MAG: hypothetical protein KDA20_06070 [Phycisphaerales bacterium]|nr:hypothetical protein [Phycisphaerales bacterium]